MSNKNTISKSERSMIYVANKLLDCVYRMSLPERRILWMIVKDYELNKSKTLNVHNVISHREYAELYGISPNQACKEISEACRTFVHNNYFIHRPEWDENALDGLDLDILTEDEIKALKGFQTGNFVDHCKYSVGRGVSEVVLARGFIDLMMPVGGKLFTQYRLFNAKSLNHATHVALYELLKRWYVDTDGRGYFKTTPFRLINSLGLPKSYKAYTQMRRGFLTPALAAIEEKTDLTVELEEVREEGGRNKVLELHFIIHKNTKNEKQIQEEINSFT